MGKAYLARHYVRVDGEMRVPGEVFETAFAATQEERLVRLGAVEVVEDGDETPPPIAGARVPPLSGEALDGADSPEAGGEVEPVPPACTEGCLSGCEFAGDGADGQPVLPSSVTAEPCHLTNQGIAATGSYDDSDSLRGAPPQGEGCLEIDAAAGVSVKKTRKGGKKA